VRFGVLATLAIAVATDAHNIWTLYAAAALVGTAEVFYDNAAQTFLPSIVEPDKLHRSNGRLAAAELVANGFVGPPLGAALFVIAAALPFIVDATTFGLSMLLILAIPGAYKPAATTGPDQRRLTAEITEGLRWLWHHDLIRTLAVLLAVTNFVGNAALSLLVLFAEDNLGLGGIGFGLLLTAGAAGGLLGALVAGRVNRLIGPKWTLLGAYLTIGIALGLIGITSSPIAAGTFFGVLSFAGMVWNVVTVSARQSLIPDELLGRVNSVYRLLGWGAIPLGAAAGGILASFANLRAVFMAGAIIQLAVAAIAARSLITSARSLQQTR
jgi:MFS family permease